MTRIGSLLTGMALLCCGAVLAQDPSDADPEMERTRALVEAGALPRKALQEASTQLEVERLERRLRELSSKSSLALNESTDLLRVAARLLELARGSFERSRERVDAGAAPAKTLALAREDLDSAVKRFELAQTRARLVKELAAMAAAENRLEELEEDELAFVFEGEGEWDNRIGEIALILEEEIGYPLPISALGDTDLHRSMGLDHTGRYDIALHPDDLDGILLMALLESRGVPYLAFRTAVPGQATGPHIHIGMPSPPLVVAGE